MGSGPQTVFFARSVGSRGGISRSTRRCLPPSAQPATAIGLSPRNYAGRRRFAAAEAVAAGRGGIIAVARITGIARSTIGRGLAELRGEAEPEAAPGRVRRKGAGRPAPSWTPIRRCSAISPPWWSRRRAYCDPNNSLGLCPAERCRRHRFGWEGVRLLAIRSVAMTRSGMMPMRIPRDGLSGGDLRQKG